MNRLLLLPLLGLAACTDPHMVLAPDFGNSVASNIAAQVDNPAPNMRTDVHMSDGKRMHDAIERYRTGHVYPPIPALEPTVKEGRAADQPPPSTPAGQ
jgi:type IV pilus biogenesis protein CpaD/CtpE